LILHVESYRYGSRDGQFKPCHGVNSINRDGVEPVGQAISRGMDDIIRRA